MVCVGGNGGEDVTIACFCMRERAKMKSILQETKIPCQCRQHRADCLALQADKLWQGKGTFKNITNSQFFCQ